MDGGGGGGGSSSGQQTTPRWNEPSSPVPSRTPWKKVSSSESEFSDTERSSEAAKLRSIQTRIRQGALELLQELVKVVDRRVMYGYWASFFPDTPPNVSVPHSHTILTVILMDPSSQVRATALCSLTNMLEWSKKFLALAEVSEKLHPAFTPLSFTIACMIQELHRGLLLALVAENYSQTVVQILKCLTTLVVNTCYCKMGSSLLVNLIGKVRRYVASRDVDTRVAALKLVSAVASALPSPPTQLTQCLVSDGGQTTDDLSSSSSWLLDVCRKDAESQLCQVPIRVEALQLLSVLVKFHFHAIRENTDAVTEVINSCLLDTYPSVQLHAARLLDTFNRRLQADTDETRVKTPEQMADMWTFLVHGPLLPLIQNQNQSNLRSAGSECLSGIGELVFSELSSKTKILCVTLLLGLGSDEDKNVRISAIHTLGVYTLYPDVQQDISFVVDVAHTTLQALEDGLPEVQLQAIWTISNISDALVLNKETGNTSFCDDFSDMLLFKLMTASLDLTRNEKLRSSGIRALGNFLRYLGERPLGKANIVSLCTKSVDELIRMIETSRVVKAKWNACFAFSNMFKNNDLPVLSDVVMMSKCLEVLQRTLRESKNFKVRINATMAITSLSERRYYGDSLNLSGIWNDVAVALESTQHVTNHAEAKYMQNLNDALCQAMCHFATLVTSQDLPLLADVINRHIVVTFSAMDKFRSVPDRAQVAAAAAHVNNLDGSEEHLASLRALFHASSDDA